MSAEIPEEYKGLIETLQKMNLTPKADTPEDLQKWIAEFAKQQAAVKTEPSESSTSTPVASFQSFQPPRLNIFSGSTDKKTGETTYPLWRYEIEGLRKDKTHSDEVIIQAIRKSVRGDAGMIAMRLGPQATLGQILAKMDSVFGSVDDRETIMSEFYNAKQKDDEDVATWSCRLEAILDKAIQSGKVDPTQANEMLHDMLWKGSKPAIKDISHFEKERYKNFDALRIALRKLEKEYHVDHPTRKITIKQAVTTSKEDESEFSGVLKQINTRLEQLESNQQTMFIGRGQDQKNRFNQGPQRYQRWNNYRGRGGSRGRGFQGQRYQQQQQYQQNQTEQQSAEPKPSNYPVMTCNRCGREGHLARGCIQNTDVNGKTLNAKQSATRGSR